MFCSKCGKQLKEGTKFCTQCGSPTPHKENDSIKNNGINNRKKTSKNLQWIFGAIFCLFAVVNGFHYSSILLALSAVLLLPIPFIRNFLKEKFKLTSKLAIILAIALFFVGTLLAPTSNTTSDTPSPSSPVEDTTTSQDTSSSIDTTIQGNVLDTTALSPETANPADTSNNNDAPPENSETTSTPETTSKSETTSKPVTTNKPETTSPAVPTTPVTPSPVGGGVAKPVNPSNLPAYSGNPYVVINNNIPSFSSAELTIVGYEKYSSLDSLGRCGVAIASCGKEIMPAADEQKGSISNITPSGWNQAKYDGISGGWLWNRCHLIGWQLSAENANKQNLITGTRYMNVDGMLPFENMVADYIKETGNHVAYRVTPIFTGNNLVCSGVQMEAYSIEDNGEGIEFNVYCYNVQPGIIINYSDGSSSSENTPDTTPPETTVDPNENTGLAKYVLNTSTKKFHHPSCSSAKRIAEKNYAESNESRDTLISQGYSPCGNCDP